VSWSGADGARCAPYEEPPHRRRRYQHRRRRTVGCAPRTIRIGATILGLALAVLACHHEPPISADVAARIGSQLVPYARFERFLQRQVGEGAGALDSRVLSRLFDQFLDGELLVRLAADEKRASAQAEPRAALEALLAEADSPIPEADVQRYYAAHAQELALPERVRLHHILTASEAQAEAARARVEGGEDFAAVARGASIDPSAPVGGDQGEIALDDLPAAFAQAVQQLQPGETSDPLQAADGWHLFRLDERLPRRQRPLAEVAPEIESHLRQERGNELVKKRLHDAAARYNVVVYAQNLPFDYRGDHPRADQKETP